MIIKVVESQGRQVVKVYQRGLFAQGGVAGSTTADQVPLNPPVAGLPATTQGAVSALAEQNKFLENTFQQSALSVAGVLPIVHNFGKSTNKVFIWDSAGRPVNPDDVNAVSTSATAVELSTYQPLSGVWRYRIEV